MKSSIYPVLMGLIIAAAIVQMSPTRAASFDCKKARAPVELDICKDGVLSLLDSALEAEVKSALGRNRAQREILLAGQREWLQTREHKCVGSDHKSQTEISCLWSVYADRIAELEMARPDFKPQLAGSWSLQFPCTLTKEECDGRSDIFSLDLWTTGAQLCGTHLSTAHLGNKVDENDGDALSIVGTIKGPTATVEFKSSWGGAGHARLTKIADGLLWTITDEDGGQNWLADAAILKLQPAPLSKPRPKACDATHAASVGPG